MSKLVGFSRNKYPNASGGNFGNFEAMREERRRRLTKGWSRRPLHLFLAEVVPGFQATDSRDLIYAFLGLQTSSMIQAINPDYRLDYETVLVESAIAIVRETASLAIFSVLGDEPRGLLSDSTEQVSTWFIDRGTGSRIHRTTNILGISTLQGGQQYSPVRDVRFLNVLGKVVASVSYVLSSELASTGVAWQKTLRD
ncbi:MAG: hypothetical protein M1818_001769 [Claussenomyces sp. TS43310]|nr:MAG: hypothetical protein M1818_001769 [Claussenomyces sp. TS43310]